MTPLSFFFFFFIPSPTHSSCFFHLCRLLRNGHEVIENTRHLRSLVLRISYICIHAFSHLPILFFLPASTFFFFFFPSLMHEHKDRSEHFLVSFTFSVSSSTFHSDFSIYTAGSISYSSIHDSTC